MKYALAWHVKCLANQQFSLKRLKYQRDMLNIEIDALEKETEFYKFQIAEALRHHKHEFDRERWRVAKSKPEGGEQ